jgi:hypothetical protein
MNNKNVLSFTDYADKQFDFIAREAKKGHIHLVDGKLADVYQHMLNNNITTVCQLDKFNFDVLKENLGPSYANYLTSQSS